MYTVRRYTAATAAEAVLKAKRELGPDVFIAEVKKVQASGLLGRFQPPRAEVTAMADLSIRLEPSAGAAAIVCPAPPVPEALPPAPSAGSAPPPRRPRRPALATATVIATATSPASVTAPAPGRTLLRPQELEAQVQALSDSLGRLERRLEVGLAGLAPATAGVSAGVATGVSAGAVPAATDPAAVANGGNLRQGRALLVAQGVPMELAEAVAARVAGRARPQEDFADAALRELPPWLDAVSGICARTGKQLVVALVGPTGAGKTTTAAKLAGGFALRQGLRVGLIAADRYRIGAAAQLKTYADIIGVPMATVQSPVEAAAALAQLAGTDLVLVDTAGAAGADLERLAEIRAILAALQPAETHLVVSLATAPRAALVTARAFGRLGVNRLLCTKWDEATGPATLLALRAQYEWPLSYITFGQSVPDDLAAAASVDWTAFLAAGVGS